MGTAYHTFKLRVVCFLALVIALVFSGCGGGNSNADPYTAPSEPKLGISAGDLFMVNTPNYFNSYTPSTEPFSPSSQFTNPKYPIPVSYTSQVTGPAGFDLKTDSESAIRAWAAADPRVAIISGVTPGHERISVELVDQINYNNMHNIIGLTTMISSGSNPRFAVLVTDKDPSSNTMMPVYEIDRTLTHELGHAFGLGHSPNPQDVMYYQGNSEQGTSYQTYLTYGDACTIWTTLNNRHINWYQSRPAITLPMVTGVRPVPSSPHPVVDADQLPGHVVDVYTKP